MGNLDKRRVQDLRSQPLAHGDNGRVLRIDGDGNCLFKAIIEHYRHHIGPVPSYLATHKTLRAEVTRILAEPQHQDAINTILSDEKNISVEAITAEDRTTYVQRMANVGIWGGTLELQVIAEILQSRIIVHRDGIATMIPQGAVYDTWPVGVELMYESVNAGLPQQPSLLTNNHYNLVLPEAIAQSIVAKNQTNQLDTFKGLIKKFPYPRSKEINHFKKLFLSLNHFLRSSESGSQDKSLKHKCQYHLAMLWQHLFYEFTRSQRHYNDASHEKYVLSRPADINILKHLLREAFQKSEINSFFKAYPYVIDLLIMDDYFHSHTATPEENRAFSKTFDGYIRTAIYYDRLMPLFILREHLKLILSDTDFDKAFHTLYATRDDGLFLRERKYKKSFDLFYLALIIKNDIGYNLRVLPGFKLFKWHAFDRLLSDFEKHYQTIGDSRIHDIATQLAQYIDNLMLYLLGLMEENHLNSIDIDDIELISAEQDIHPSWRIIENYLSILSLAVEDNETSRLATLRAITAVGEAIRAIALLLPSFSRIALMIIAQIRDHIIHATTLDAATYMDGLIYDSSNTMLYACLTELKGLIPFFESLKTWFTSDRNPANFPVLPALPHLHALEQSFAKARHQDDRDEPIPVAQRQALLASLPSHDALPNPLLPQVIAFIQQGKTITKNNFVAACPQLSATAAKKLLDRIIEFKKIVGLEHAVQNGQVDFDKIDLKVSGYAKEQLTRIVAEKNVEDLQNFLNEYKKKVDLSSAHLENFLSDITTIDIRPYKALLAQFVDTGISKITKNNFDKAVSLVFMHDPEQQRLWAMSYNMLTTKQINAMKRYQLIQLDYVIRQIERLQHALAPIFDGRYINTKVNPLLSIAGEMLYGFCVDGFKHIKKYLECMYDYQDQTLYFFIPNHPLQQIDALLDFAIRMRNDIFHFERFYDLPGDVEAVRMGWFSFIQHFTYGMFFPNAISITPSAVSTQACLSSPLLDALQTFRETLANDMARDKDLLNMWEAKMHQLITPSSSSSSSTLFLPAGSTTFTTTTASSIPVSPPDTMQTSNQQGEQEPCSSTSVCQGDPLIITINRPGNGL